MGEDVQRLHEDTEDNDGENPLRRWSTTKGICTYKVTSFHFLSTITFNRKKPKFEKL